jgi:hypothetical protein
VDEIDQAAREMGIFPGDPAWAFVGAMRRLIERGEAQNARLLGDLRQIMTDAVSRQATEHLPWAIDRLALQRHRQMALAAAGVLVLVLLIGIAGGWTWRSYWPAEGLPGLTCADQPDGSRICYEFVRRPAQNTGAATSHPP